MATNKKISALTALTSLATGDLFPVVDVSDTTDAATGTTKKITAANVIAGASYTPATKIVAPTGYAHYADYYTDGVADEVQINLAITAVNTLGGGDVLLVGYPSSAPAVIAAAIKLKDKVWLRGEGINATWIKKVAGGNFQALQNDDLTNGNSYIRASDFAIDGNNANGTTGRGVDFEHSSNVLVERVFLTDAVEGFKTDSCTDLTFYRCIADGNYNWNFYQYAGTRVKVIECKSLNAKASTFEGFGMAFYHNSSYCEAVGNYIYNSASNGIQVNAGSATQDNVGQIIRDNVVESVLGPKGIFVTDDGNTFHVKKASIVNNRVFGGAGKGIYLIDAYDTDVIGNKAWDNTTNDGLSYEDCVNLRSESNTSTGNSVGLRITGDGSSVYSIFDNIYSNSTDFGGTALTTSGLNIVGSTNFHLTLATGKKFNILGPNYTASTSGLLQLQTTDSAAQDLGASIALGGYINGTATYEGFGGIAGRKENSTAANTRGYLQLLTNGSERARIDSNGHLGVGVTTITALLHLKAGTATANTAPLKFTSGTKLTTPEDGAMEYDGTHLYVDIGSTRYQLDQQTPIVPDYATAFLFMGA